MKQLLFAFLFVFILAFQLLPYSTTNASVVLNEVAIQPNQGVELYNTASTSADISGWYIDDAGGTTFYTVPQQTVLAPLSCYVFTADFNFNKTSADTVRLFDNSFPPTTSSARLLESYSYTKAPDLGYSFIKKIDGGIEWHTSTSSLGLFNESLLSCIPSPTPTPFPTETPSPTLTQTPTPTLVPSPSPITLSPTTYPLDYSNIFISEVFPYPAANEHEWIELYNNNDFQVILDGWYIDDSIDTGSTPKLISLTINSYSYASVDFSSSLFNNSGDAVRLLNTEKLEKESMEYGKVTQGKSIGRTSFDNDEYCEQDSSKNIENNSCSIDPKISPKSQVSTQNNEQIKNPKTPTKTISTQSINSQFSLLNSTHSSPAPLKGEVLGAESEEYSSTIPHTITPIPYLSFVSFSYSLLTIVSIFIKIKGA